MKWRGLGNHNTALFWEYDTRLGRRWNLDPVDQISISNYGSFSLNPILNMDIYGDIVVGTDGKAVTYVMTKGGAVTWSKNASPDVMRIGNAMLKTPTGRTAFTNMQKAAYPITMTIDNTTFERQTPFALTTYDFKDEAHKKVKSASITFYMRVIDDFITDPPADEMLDEGEKMMKDNKFDEDDHLGVNGSHESAHATDPQAIKEFVASFYNNEDVDFERIPEQKEKQDIVERVKQKTGGPQELQPSSPTPSTPKSGTPTKKTPVQTR